VSDHVNRNQQDEPLSRLDETPDVEVVREILLTEYKCLRDEVCKKMDHRVSLIVSSVTTSVVALGVGVERGSGPILLLTPIIAGIFGLFIIFHDRQIGEVSDYICDKIESPLLKHYPNSIGWHLMRRRTVGRRERFPGFYLPLFVVIFVPSVAGFSLAWTFRNPLGLTIPLAIASLGLLIVYPIQYRLAVNRSFPNWRARTGQSKDGAA
jgi:hypothetical protein